MRVGHDADAAAFLGQLAAFTSAAEGLDDARLGAATRCHGWLACDLLVHVHLGLQEMLLGALDPTDERPDRDAATYWSAFTPGTDPTDGLLDDRFLRLVAAAYRRPTSAVAHLRETADGLHRTVRAGAPGAVRFQGHVLSTGDFLATWAVELAVHHLDLGRELDLPAPHPGALRMARETVEALVGELLPPEWSDEAAVLAGTGRVALDDRMREQAGPLATRLPAFG
ncbi:maleylpyruvate isomerase N-terminal domain-containing protein [Pseudonocardia lacus]|uniref:maleylpyruvate isomerase N-terminal domain-containing protein n=1 Tax=Pseudonocardia lacus TaxID=2835865 RepID=UPI001BDD422A|nr:maleylpyruvate isomerase N-terminal domain-containing protein [Pseudonocardia lacus]